MIFVKLQTLFVQFLKKKNLNIDVVQNLVFVQKVNAMVKMIFVEQQTLPFQFLKDIN